MRTIFKISAIASFLFLGITMEAQKNRSLDNYREPDKNGINVFESPKDTVSTFDGLKVRVGGSFALQFQAIDHENSGNLELLEIGDNFNLATANLDLDVALYDGVRMHLRTYLSSRHHPEPYVKGGYFLIDKLEFIQEGFMEDLMKHLTIKIGHFENNYGDTHFRRSDNAQALYNPFVGNYIMDAFTTEVGGEVYYRNNGWLAMVGVTNGKLNQSVDNPETTDPSFVAKVGYDNYLSEDLRFRLTGSLYTTNKSARTYLYAGDRAGARYYLVMENPDASSSSNFRSGRWDPGFRNELTAFMINPFIKYKGLEFFGVFENSSGRATGEAEERTWNQYAGELLYRFGNNENFYVGGRYNVAEGETQDGYDASISRLNLGAGWFLTKNILAKLEYVNQQYDDFATTSIYNEGQFDGVMFEAVISF
ncbi:hypothetical protein SAMN04487907_101150 [Zunongwangia mangrovi]|uniref:Phosphate-selective porin O and P n=1 Tax=Zunongwangia mangrovi TaxID=1334022 RepID=A0A1I1D575_9FLAO|nr:hypothetical protein [Zunongwangia mangrovi]SFB70179.1 hypothetical protein SAMN04487907_101150 [Zunongwangia mangrovi]